MAVTCNVSEIRFVVASTCAGKKNMFHLQQTICKDATMTANFNNETCTLTPTTTNDNATYILDTSDSW